jgi:hypothetical protein
VEDSSRSTHRKVEFLGVDGLSKRPGEVMFPHGLQDGLLQELQLICDAPGSVRGRLNGRLDHAVHRFEARWRLFVFVSVTHLAGRTLQITKLVKEKIIFQQKQHSYNYEE